MPLVMNLTVRAVDLKSARNGLNGTDCIEFANIVPVGQTSKFSANTAALFDPTY